MEVIETITKVIQIIQLIWYCHDNEILENRLLTSNEWALQEQTKEEDLRNYVKKKLIRLWASGAWQVSKTKTKWNGGKIWNSGSGGRSYKSLQIDYMLKTNQLIHSDWVKISIKIILILYIIKNKIKDCIALRNLQHIQNVHCLIWFCFNSFTEYQAWYSISIKSE